jgi:hypothetical protein
MRQAVSALIALVIAAGAGAAPPSAPSKVLDHNRFKWRDAAGDLHYADVLPPEALKYGYDVVSPRGFVVRHVERAKTAEELAAAKAEAARAASAKDAADAAARSDEQLLAGYPEESDLKRAQKEKLEMLEQQVVAAQISLRSQEQVLAELLGRAAEAERTGKPLPEAEVKQLAVARRHVDEQRAMVDRRTQERDGASAKFEAETARYRELRARRAADAAAGP